MEQLKRTKSIIIKWSPQRQC